MAQECFQAVLTDKQCSVIFQGLTLSSWQPDVLRLEVDVPSELSEACSERQLEESLQNLTVSSRMSCSVCGCIFHTRLQQTEHYKLDWHRFNLKQSMMGADPVSEEDFEFITGDISSISGSDDSVDETPSVGTLIENTPESPQKREDDEVTVEKARGRGLPKILFENGRGQLVAIYRCLLQGKKESSLTQSELVSRATNLKYSQKWTILMVAGGHFAAAIFSGSEVISHKTFHRYTVRAKRGTAQGVKDGQQGGKAPRSAGAALRRYNEAQLQEDVGSLLKSWKENIDGCTHIFIRAPSYNRALFFGGKNAVLRRDDDRVKTIPFPTRRPTFKEVKRVQNLLSTVDCYDTIDAAKRKFLPAEVASDKLLPEKGEEQVTIMEQGHVLTKHVNGVVDVEEAQRGKKVEDDLSDKDEMPLVLEEITSTTSHLKEAEISVPKRRRKKKKSTLLKEGYEMKDKELTKIQAAIYTCCRSNRDNNFDNLVMELRQKFSQEMEGMELGALIDEAGWSGICEKEQSCENGLGEGSFEFTKDNKDDVICKGSISVGRILEASVGASEMTSLENGVEPHAPYGTLVGPKLTSDGSSTKCEHPLADSGCIASTEDGNSGKIEESIARFLNEKLDGSENRFLHVAAANGNISLLWNLMSSGADPALKNVKGHPPFNVAKDRPTRQEFRRFMGEFPDRYDYKMAQIPAPLTEEQEVARATKQAERRREQKKTRKNKQKEQKAEQQRKEEEERERQKFVALSDREKRALAAEKRLANQLHMANRCFGCGIELAGKVPFHYQDFKFCSMDCLKKHKQQSNNT